MVLCGGRRTATSAAKETGANAADMVSTPRKEAGGKRESGNVLPQVAAWSAGLQRRGWAEKPIQTFAFYSPFTGILLPFGKVVKMEETPYFSLFFESAHA